MREASDEGIDSVFEGALDLRPLLQGPPLSQSAMEATRSGHGGSQTDSVRTLARITGDALEPVELRHEDQMVEYRPNQEILDGNPVPPPPSSEKATLFLVQVVQVGGSAGSANSTCSFTYDVTALDGSPLLQGAPPYKFRASLGKYNAGGPYGVAAKLYNGQIILWDANEMQLASPC